jgi:hypothetical protein
MKRLALLALLAAAPLAAQKDFLTADEVDQLRESQEPPERLRLYVRFAQQRMDLLEQAFAKEKAGRSSLIHDTLDEFSQIMEAIDTVTDDALHRGKQVTNLGEVAKAQREMIAKLERFRGSNPKDLPRYQFALDQAIETAKDSADLSDEDIKDRTRNVEAREKKEKEDHEAMSAPQVPATKDADSKSAGKTADDSAKAAGSTAPATPSGRKPPTLRRPGETPNPPKPTDKP